MSVATVRSLRRVDFGHFPSDGVLSVFAVEQGGVPFPIVRVFTITGVSPQGVRGDHAHRGCTQLLACLAGAAKVEVHDGRENVTETLIQGGSGLLIPPLLWNSVIFEGPSTVLAVFCDELFDPDDYLRDWDEYVQLREALRP